MERQLSVSAAQPDNVSSPFDYRSLGDSRGGSRRHVSSAVDLASPHANRSDVWAVHFGRIYFQDGSLPPRSSESALKRTVLS